MSLELGQPSIRFNGAGPFGFQGIAFVPKVVTFRKAAIAGTTTDDFYVAPAGCYILDAFIRADIAVNNSGTVTLGTDGDPDALITTTGFSCGTTGNFAHSLSSTLTNTGLYMNAGDTIRLACAGTATTGGVSGFLVIFEVSDMISDGVHFNL